MPQNQVASGTCDRHVNPADGVGSLTNGHEHIRPTRKGVWSIKMPKRVGQNRNPKPNCSAT